MRPPKSDGHDALKAFVLSLVICGGIVFLIFLVGGIMWGREITELQRKALERR